MEAGRVAGDLRLPAQPNGGMDSMTSFLWTTNDYLAIVPRRRQPNVARARATHRRRARLG